MKKIRVTNSVLALFGLNACLAAGTHAADVPWTLQMPVRQAVAFPDMKDCYAETGADVFVSSPEEFSAFVKSEIERRQEIVKKYGIVRES